MKIITNQLSVIRIIFFLCISFAINTSFGQILEKENLTFSGITSNQNNIQKIPKHWKKLNIDNKIYLYLPPKLTKTGLTGNPGILAAYKRNIPNGFDFYLNYAYGKNVPSDLNPRQGKTQMIIVSGKKAELNVWEQDSSSFRKDPPGMKLVISDIDINENKFELYMIGSDKDLMSEIIKYIKIK